MVRTWPLGKQKLVRLIESYVGAVSADERGVLRGWSHGDLTRRNIRGQGLCWLDPYVIDFEFFGRRSISYDYFYYYISPFVWRRELAPILRFVRRDRRTPLVIAGIDLSAEYDRYLDEFVDEWAGYFIPDHHDLAERALFQAFIGDLKRALASTELSRAACPSGSS